jgi:ribosome-associated protein
MIEVAVSLPINLGQFLKAAGVVGSGGDAKGLVVSGGVSVNGQTELRRGRKLVLGDVVEASGAMWRVEDRAAAPRSGTPHQENATAHKAPARRGSTSHSRGRRGT